MISDAIRTLIINAATLAGSRVAVDLMPEGTARPYVMIQQIGGRMYLAHDGASGLRSYSFQLMAVAASGADARTLIEQCRTALHMYAGAVGGDVIQRIHAQSEPRVNYELDANAYTASMDFEAGYVG